MGKGEHYSCSHKGVQECFGRAWSLPKFNMRNCSICRQWKYNCIFYCSQLNKLLRNHPHQIQNNNKNNRRKALIDWWHVQVWKQNQEVQVEIREVHAEAKSTLEREKLLYLPTNATTQNSRWHWSCTSIPWYSNESTSGLFYHYKYVRNRQPLRVKTKWMGSVGNKSNNDFEFWLINYYQFKRMRIKENKPQ